MIQKGLFQGQQLFPHDMYRRQQYPPVFEISHYIAIMRRGELDKLGSNLYNEDTLYYGINPGTVDVDSKEDLLKYIYGEK